MKIPPKKPHFFKPILPGFKDGLKIPIGFLKYLKGQDHIECATLKRTGKKWLVKLKGRRLEDGWEEFTEELNLQLGDLLIFKHEGDMEFEVSIFDTSHCEREYGAEEKAPTPEETSKKFEFKAEKPSPRIESSGKASYHTEAATHNPFGQSRFVYTIRAFCITYGFMYVPKHFAYANGLIANKKCSLIIKDEMQRSWNLRISSCKTQVYIGDGCREFIADNCLKEGDRIMFEVVTDGETPIWKFHVVSDAETPMRKFQEKPKPNIMSSHNAFPDLEAAKDMLLGRPHLISTVKPYWISKSMMHVPKLFAREGGLSNRKCRIMIRDEQRSWVFRLYYSAGSTFIGGGWRKFCAANFLKEGDRIMFEILSKGEKPTLKFYDLRGEVSLSPEGKKTNLDTERVSSKEKPNTSIKSSIKASSHAKAAPHKPFGHSNFVCTIRPYCLTHGFMYVPKHFAYANGLIANKKCGLIIKDETQRSWNLRISSCKTQVYIGDGCREFIADNCLKEGDHIMFEVVTDGETPIWKFHVVTDAETPMRKFQGKCTGKDAKCNRSY